MLRALMLVAYPHHPLSFAMATPSNLDGAAQDDSALSAQVGPLSPAVTRLTLDEGLGDLEIPIHDLMDYVEYDSVLSTPPPASPPPNDAIATDSTSPAMSPPERRHRTLAHRNGRMPLRPASAGADDDAAIDNIIQSKITIRRATACRPFIPALATGRSKSSPPRMTNAPRYASMLK
ncbi:hypothetical protein FB107DRAFT_274454 [Schizophyllum commune]